MSYPDKRTKTLVYWDRRRLYMIDEYQRRRREKDTPEALYRRERFGEDRGISSTGVPA